MAICEQVINCRVALLCHLQPKSAEPSRNLHFACGWKAVCLQPPSSTDLIFPNNNYMYRFECTQPRWLLNKHLPIFANGIPVESSWIHSLGVVLWFVMRSIHIGNQNTKKSTNWRKQNLWNQNENQDSRHSRKGVAKLGLKEARRKSTPWKLHGMGTAPIWPSVNLTTGKIYVVDSTIVTSVGNRGGTFAPLGNCKRDEKSLICCHTFWGLVDRPTLTRTFWSRSIEITFAGQRFVQEFFITRTALPIPVADFLTRNNIILDNSNKALNWT